MLAYAASQWQANAAKNQLVLGPNGKQAVISAEDFEQISTIKIPDPGQATTNFILANVIGATQTINGNLTVTGTINSSGGSGGDDLLNGDLVFSNAADRSIRFNAAKVTGSSSLSILGNDSLDGAGGDVLITAGSGGDIDNGGNILITSGISGATSGDSGDVTIASGESVNDADTGDVIIKTGGVGANGDAGDIKLLVGASNLVPTGGNVLIRSGDNASNGDQAGNVLLVGGDNTETNGGGGDIKLTAGLGATIAKNGGISIGTDNAPGLLDIGHTDMTVPIRTFKSVKMQEQDEGFLWTTVNSSIGGSTITANAKAGRVTFTGVTIAGNAQVDFIINNTSATGRGLAVFACTTVPPDASNPYVAVINWSANTITVTVRNRTATTTGSLNWTIDFLCLE